MTKTSPLLSKRFGAGIAAVFSQSQAGSPETEADSGQVVYSGVPGLTAPCGFLSFHDLSLQ